VIDIDEDPTIDDEMTRDEDIIGIDSLGSESRYIGIEYRRSI
jgi:hypothetical protein